MMATPTHVTMTMTMMTVAFDLNDPAVGIT